MASIGSGKQQGKLILAAVVIIVLAVAAFKFAGNGKGGPAAEPFTFRDAAGESISVAFDNERDVAVLEGEGYRGLELQHATSASGARYENTQEKLVLWNKGDEVTLYKNDEVIFTGTDTRAEAETPAQTPQAARPAAPAAPVTPAPATLNGRSFRLSSHNGFVIPESERYTLSFETGNPTFEDGFVHAKFCNNLNGAYKMTGNVIDADLVGTKMYCTQPAGLMDREGAFSSLITGGARMTLQGNALTLTDGITTMVFLRI